jgi:hypothetical protein
VVTRAGRESPGLQSFVVDREAAARPHDQLDWLRRRFRNTKTCPRARHGRRCAGSRSGARRIARLRSRVSRETLPPPLQPCRRDRVPARERSERAAASVPLLKQTPSILSSPDFTRVIERIRRRSRAFRRRNAGGDRFGCSRRGRSTGVLSLDCRMAAHNARSRYLAFRTNLNERTVSDRLGTGFACCGEQTRGCETSAVSCSA